MASTSFQYDVCLSFAGEDREYVEAVAAGLKERGVRVFYDRYAMVELWGKDLYEHLDFVYGKAAQYCVLFVSDAYARKIWTSHERKSAQDRAITEHREYILPARFDDTEVPGLRGTVGHIDLRSTTPDELVDLIVQKLGAGQQRATPVPVTPAPVAPERARPVPATPVPATPAPTSRAASAGRSRRQPLAGLRAMSIARTPIVAVPVAAATIGAGLAIVLLSSHPHSAGAPRIKAKTSSAQVKHPGSERKVVSQPSQQRHLSPRRTTTHKRRRTTAAAGDSTSGHTTAIAAQPSQPSQPVYIRPTTSTPSPAPRAHEEVITSKPE